MSMFTYHAYLFISLFTREKTFHQLYNTFFTLISDTHIHQTRHSVINLVLLALKLTSALGVLNYGVN